MIKYEGLTDFWIRHDRQKSRMSIAEIRSAIMATEDLTMKVEHFIAERRLAVRSGRSELTYALMATPLLLEDGRIDPANASLKALLQEPPSYRPVDGVNISSNYARIVPTLRGVRTFEEDTSRLEVFRTGHVEFVLLDRFLLAERPENRRIKGWAAAELIRNFVFLVDAIRKMRGSGDTYLFTVSMLFCEGYAMPHRFIGRFGEGRTNTLTDGPDVLMDPIHSTIDDDPDHTTRRLAECVPLERCPFFDAEGRFSIPAPA